MFNHNTLEKDIERLSREVAEKRSLPENKNVSERELVRETVKPLVKEAFNKPQATAAPKDEEDDSGTPSYLKESPGEVKLIVEKLVDSVFHDGLRKAVAKARKSNPFILDAFHDALADKLYDELKKRKLI